MGGTIQQKNSSFNRKNSRSKKSSWKNILVAGAVALAPLIACGPSTHILVLRNTYKKMTDVAITNPKDNTTIEKIPFLIDGLGHEDFEIAFSASLALAFIGVPSMLPVMEALKDEDPNVRYWAAVSLSHNKELRIEQSSFVTAALIKALQDDDTMVKAQAAYALESLEDLSAAPALLHALKDKDPQVRKAAAFALGKCGDKSVLNELKRVMETDSDRGVREKAAESYNRISRMYL